MRGHKKYIMSLNTLYFLLRIYLHDFRFYFVHPKSYITYLFTSLLSFSSEHKDMLFGMPFTPTQVTLCPSWIVFIVYPWVCLCASFCTFHFLLVIEYFELVSPCFHWIVEQHLIFHIWFSVCNIIIGTQ